jgi:signal peptidase I
MVFLIRDNTILFTPTISYGKSMQPTKSNYSIGITIYPNKLNRGDIIVFSKLYENKKIFLIKRIIGLPGEYVENLSGFTQVNRDVLKEPYANYTGTNRFSSSFKKIMRLSKLEGNVIPKDYFFVLGDNRNYSLDSRDFGLVHKSEIIGKEIVHSLKLDIIQPILNRKLREIYCFNKT